MVLAPCVADLDRLRLTAHFSGDVGDALPYLNGVLPQASYVATLPVLIFMDGHRMVSLYLYWIVVAKADDIVDAWASLERLRCLVNDAWSRRAEIIPSSELHRWPPALEVYKRLPGDELQGVRRAHLHRFRLGRVARRGRHPRLSLRLRR